MRFEKIETCWCCDVYASPFLRNTPVRTSRNENARFIHEKIQTWELLIHFSHDARWESLIPIRIRLVLSHSLHHQYHRFTLSIQLPDSGNIR